MIHSGRSRPSSSSSNHSRKDINASVKMTTTSADTPLAHTETEGASTLAKSVHSPSNSLTQTGETSRTNSTTYPHCSFCLVAEFDIDKGSTLSYQYPAPIGHDEYMLAELMLPDGVHARSEDWTVFFLPADSEEGGKGNLGQQQGNFRLSEDGNGTANSSKGKERSRDDLFYVLNLVRTKHDNTVRRGALVKAIAIGTRHPFIHVFKPALLLALDDYFKSPSIEVLMRLFDSLNSLDLSAMPVFTRDEKLILRASERRDLFEERFKEVPAGRAASGLRHLANMNLEDDEKNRYTSTRSRSGSTSTTQSSIADEGTRAGTGPHGRSTPHLPHRPSLASLRPGSSGSGIMKRRPSAAAQLQLQQASGGLDGSHISLPNNTTWRRPSGAAVSQTAMLGNGKIKDTHYWDTSVTYGKVQELPIRIPTDVFSEEVGEYSLIALINTFASSTPVGPLHAHLHSNGQLTPPLIILFNAIVTGKRIVFLGHNQPASRVASHVLSACALGSGCGSGWRGIARRCFPYANLGTMDELEKVPGYIAGVTNPRFEDLHAWDLLFNIENGKITIAKDIEPVAPMRTNTKHSMTEAISSGSLGSNLGFGTPPDGDHPPKLSRTPTEPDVSTSGVSSFTTTSTSSAKGRDRSGNILESKADAPEIIFMEEVILAVAARYGEKYVRSRFSDWAANFIKQVARHEEHFYGQTSIAPSSQPYLNGQLGSGVVSTDREMDLKEVQMNALRIEAFRATESYKLYRNDEAIRESNRFVTGFDLTHQLARLRKAKRIHTSECELIFTTIAKSTKSSEQIIELLALLPAHHGGLFSLSCGLLHSSIVVRSASQELLLRLATHPVGKKFVQNLNMFHRLAFARLLHESTSEPTNMANITPNANLYHHTQANSMSPPYSHASQGHTMNPSTSNGREGFPSLNQTSTGAATSLTLPVREGLPAIDNNNNNTASMISAHLSRSNSPAAYT